MRIWDEKEHFIQKFYVKEEPLFLEMRERAKKEKCDHMMVAPSEARLLQSIVEVSGAKKILEIGCLHGYSAIYFVRGISGEGKVWTLEKNEANAKIAKEFFAKADVGNKIELVLGDAHENLKSLEKLGPFDLIFIDADKAGYPNYLTWAEKHVRKGGLVIADNTFLGGSMWGKEQENYSKTQTTAMMEFHERFSDPKNFKSIIYPSHDGIAVGVKV